MVSSWSTFIQLAMLLQVHIAGCHAVDNRLPVAQHQQTTVQATGESSSSSSLSGNTSINKNIFHGRKLQDYAADSNCIDILGNQFCLDLNADGDAGMQCVATWNGITCNACSFCPSGSASPMAYSCEEAAGGCVNEFVALDCDTSLKCEGANTTTTTTTATPTTAPVPATMTIAPVASPDITQEAQAPGATAVNTTTTTTTAPTAAVTTVFDVVDPTPTPTTHMETETTSPSSSNTSSSSNSGSNITASESPTRAPAIDEGPTASSSTKSPSAAQTDNSSTSSSCRPPIGLGMGSLVGIVGVPVVMQWF